jgi:hypothetical protein
MAPKKKEEPAIIKIVANTEATLELLKAEYSRKPSKQLGSIIVAQELSLMEMKQVLRSEIGTQP